jgi:hypothetical protein
MDAMFVITALYIIFNTGRVLSYLPQIFAVAREKSAATAISLVTWLFWTGANLTTGLYATFKVPDFYLALMSYGNALGCIAVVIIVMFKRAKYPYIKGISIKSATVPSISGEMSRIKPLKLKDTDIA